MIIKERLGMTFSPAQVLLGFLLLTVAVIGMIAGFLIQVILVLLLIGGMLISTTKRVKIDTIKGTVKDYNLYFGILGFGESYDLSKYPYLSILKKRFSSHITTWAMNRGKISEDVVYDICLLSSNHRKKLVVSRSASIDKARIKADELADALGREVVDYAPVVSDMSRRNRRR